MKRVANHSCCQRATPTYPEVKHDKYLISLVYIVKISAIYIIELLLYPIPKSILKMTRCQKDVARDVAAKAELKITVVKNKSHTRLNLSAGQ